MNYTNDPDEEYVISEEPRNELIYGRDEGRHTAYADHLWKWDFEAASAAAEAVEGFTPHTPRCAEAWLSAYYGRQVYLCGLIQDGGNLVYRFDYIDEDVYALIAHKTQDGPVYISDKAFCCLAEQVRQFESVGAEGEYEWGREWYQDRHDRQYVVTYQRDRPIDVAVVPGQYGVRRPRT